MQHACPVDDFTWCVISSDLHIELTLCDLHCNATCADAQTGKHVLELCQSGHRIIYIRPLFVVLVIRPSGISRLVLGEGFGPHMWTYGRLMATATETACGLAATTITTVLAPLRGYRLVSAVLGTYAPLAATCTGPL